MSETEKAEYNWQTAPDDQFTHLPDLYQGIKIPRPADPWACIPNADDDEWNES